MGECVHGPSNPERSEWHLRYHLSFLRVLTEIMICESALVRLCTDGRFAPCRSTKIGGEQKNARIPAQSMCPTQGHDFLVIEAHAPKDFSAFSQVHVVSGLAAGWDHKRRLLPDTVQTNLMWGAPLAPSGRRPSGGQLLPSGWSVRPGRQGMWGPVNAAGRMHAVGYITTFEIQQPL